MLDALNGICLSIMDPLLGWMLHLPRDLILVVVGVGTAALLTFVRLFTTDQDLLTRCKADRRRLKQLMRRAKKGGDKEAVARHQATMRQISMIQFRAEGKPLLASVIPIALVAIWCFARIAYLPPAAADPVVVRAYFPVSGIGRLVHIIPQDGLEAETGWIQKVGEDVDVSSGAVTNGIAEWRLRCRQRKEPYALAVRYMGNTFEKDLLVDGRRYAAPLRAYEDDCIEVVEIAMPPYRLFGVVPGLPSIMLQPWIVGYLVIVVPLALVLKPVLRIR